MRDYKSSVTSQVCIKHKTENQFKQEYQKVAICSTDIDMHSKEYSKHMQETANFNKICNTIFAMPIIQSTFQYKF